MKTLLLLSLALLACGHPGASISVDATGGAVALPGGPSLEIPAGALSAATVIGIEESGASAPSGAVSKVYKFTPEGQSFLKPVNVIFQVPAGLTGSSLYWTKQNSTTDYDAIAVTVAGQNATGQVTHFSQGVLVAGRDLAGAFTDVHQPDTGASTALAVTQAAGETVSATVLMKSNSSGYMTFPGTLKNDGSFTVPGVPSGNYFFTITPPSPPTRMVEAGSATPDLSDTVSTRVDAITAAGGTRVALNLSGLDPWATGDTLQIVSSQAGVFMSGFPGANPPANAATTYTGTIIWTGGLASSTKGDTVYVLQSVPGTAGSGSLAATTSALKNCASSPDYTVSGGTTSSGPATALTAATASGSLGADVLYSQYEALLTQINPNAKRSEFRLWAMAKPHSVAYPDDPNAPTPVLFSLDVPLAALTSPPADTDYTAQPYGQCLDSTLWKEFRAVEYGVKVPIAGTTITDFAAAVTSADPLSPEPSGGIAPALGPVKAPLINGKDAFTPQTAVTTGPTLSWTAPALGTASGYRVTIYNASTRGALLSATVFTQTQFQVPAGVMAAGGTYFATITSLSGASFALDAGLQRMGTPTAQAPCVTAAFSP